MPIDAELLEIQRQLNEQELIKKGDVEGVVNSRVSTMKTTYDTQINELTTKLTVGQQQLHSLLVDNVIRIAASKNGAFPEALDDVVLRAKGVYTVENGVPTPALSYTPQSTNAPSVSPDTNRPSTVDPGGANAIA